MSGDLIAGPLHQGMWGSAAIKNTKPNGMAITHCFDTARVHHAFLGMRLQKNGVMRGLAVSERQL